MGRDGIIGLILLGVSGWLYRNTAAIPRPPFVPLGPAFYPRILLGILGILAILLLLSDLLGRKRRNSQRFRERVSFAEGIARYRTMILTYLIFGGYVALMPTLGFRISTILFVATLSWLLGPKTPRQMFLSLLLGVGTALTIYFVFEGYLRIFLPRGSLF